MKVVFSRMKGGSTCPPRIPLSKVVWSWLGAFISMYFVAIISSLTEVDILKSMFLVASFGASAVLIYGAPQADFSQPRNFIGGHIISALIGVTLQKYLALDIALLGALAVSLSIVAMHFTRTLHPPGGATALIAIVGSAEVHSNGYWFVISPVAIGTLILLVIALVINNLSKNPARHYPKYWY
ncbi:HPP family protein [Colwellia sp. C1TZA3]|uniref:HPP family protein n=1 Tax=Colwellia sp. C1TZA3 TaxID=2508879 RepID=UPI0011BA3BF0|nr:HPP family protein [Colwellia sp. C1TZA3]TWX65108.1 HPP family protein [Colwellia sp. C1TZA3]